MLYFFKKVVGEPKAQAPVQRRTNWKASDEI